MLHRTLIFHRNLLGLVGLPSQGKSTLFNAVTQSSLAATAVHEFTTIKAQRSSVFVHDPRLLKLAAFAGSGKVAQKDIEICDIAGLIAGASTGNGMGNAFLADIRSAAVIAHVIRCFDGVGFNTANPLDSLSIINAELILADLQAVERRASKSKNSKKKSGGPPSATAAATAGASEGFDEVAFASELQAWLEGGKPARDLPSIQPLSSSSTDGSSSSAPLLSDEKRRRAQRLIDARRACLDSMQLLSAKPVVFVTNVDEGSLASGNSYSRAVETAVGGAHRCVRVCCLVEEQLAQLSSRDEKLEMLKAYGSDAPASEELVRKVFDMLGLETFFTVGPLMAKAWSFDKGSNVRDVAGLIHGDFAKHFRAARIQSWDKFITHGNLRAAEGKMVELGASAIMPDGHVFIVEHDAKK